MTPQEAELWFVVASDAELDAVAVAVERARVAFSSACNTAQLDAAMDVAAEIQTVACIWPRPLERELRPRGLRRLYRKALVRWRAIVRGLRNE